MINSKSNSHPKMSGTCLLPILCVDFCNKTFLCHPVKWKWMT